VNGIDEPRVPRGVALWTALAASCVVVLLGALVMADWDPLTRLDRRIDVRLHEWALATPWVVDVAGFLETIGRFRVSFWVVLTVTLLLLVRRRWRTATALVATAILAPLVTDHIKPIVGRARPVWEIPLSSEPTLAYPSGHATAGIAVYVACGLALGSLIADRRLRTAVITVFSIVGIAIGLSRPVLGVHWPSDVVGGWAVAIAVGAVSVAILLARRHRRTDPAHASRVAADG